MSLFSSHVIAARGVVEQVYADGITIYQMKKIGGVNGKAGFDPDAAPIDTSGVIHQDSEREVSEMHPNVGGRVGGVDRSLHVPGDLICSVALKPGQAPIGSMLHVDPDSSSEFAGRWFNVTLVQPNGLGQIELRLAAAREPELVNV